MNAPSNQLHHLSYDNTAYTGLDISIACQPPALFEESMTSTQTSIAGRDLEAAPKLDGLIQSSTISILLSSTPPMLPRWSLTDPSGRHLLEDYQRSNPSKVLKSSKSSYSQVLIYTAERTGVSWREKTPRLRNALTYLLHILLNKIRLTTSVVTIHRCIDESRYLSRDMYHDTVCNNRDTRDLATFLHFLFECLTDINCQSAKHYQCRMSSHPQQTAGSYSQLKSIKLCHMSVISNKWSYD